MTCYLLPSHPAHKTRGPLSKHIATTPIGDLTCHYRWIRLADHGNTLSRINANPTGCFPTVMFLFGQFTVWLRGCVLQLGEWFKTYPGIDYRIIPWLLFHKCKRHMPSMNSYTTWCYADIPCSVNGYFHECVLNFSFKILKISYIWL